MSAGSSELVGIPTGTSAVRSGRLPVSAQDLEPVEAWELEVEQQEHRNLRCVVQQKLEGQTAIGEVGVVGCDAAVAQCICGQLGAIRAR